MTRLGHAIRRAQKVELELADAFTAVAKRHEADPDVFHLCEMLGEQARTHAERFQPFARRYGDVPADRGVGSRNGEDEPQTAGLSLLCDLTGLYVLAEEAWIKATVVRQAALAKRDRELLDVVTDCLQETAGQAKWLKTRIKTTAPQALTVE
jgi:hypothetical protein